MGQLKFEIGKLKYFLLGIIFTILPLETIFFVSYLNFYEIINGWILFVIGLICILYFLTYIELPKFIKFVSLAGLFFITIQFFIVIASVFGNATTDEIIIETYAAKIFIQGQDPYINSNMVGVFKFITPIYGTPMLNGNSVYFLLYPGMSVLAFIPFVYLNLPDYASLYFFSILLIGFTILYLKKKGLSDSIPYLSIILAIDISFIGLSINGSTDVIWIFFMALSYMYRDKSKLSGAMFGLSISAKQIPVLIFPYFLYLIYKEKNNSIKEVIYFTIFGIFTFFLTNLPFIIMQPHDWIRNIIEAEFQPVIGIGVGFSELSFAGAANVPSAVFTVLFITATFVFLLFYIRFYDRLKYALFVFPAIVFLFNYRLLATYILDWLILDLLAFADFFNAKELKVPLENPEDKTSVTINSPDFHNIKPLIMKNLSFFLVLAIILAGGASVAIYEDTKYNGSDIFVINSINNVSNPVGTIGYVTSINLSITYNPAQGMNQTSPVYFRIIPSTPTNGVMNGLIWKSTRNLNIGINNITILPTLSIYFLQDGTNFNIRAYYIVQSLYFSSGAVSAGNLIKFPNFNMQYPSYEQGNPYPSWYLSQNTGFNYIQTDGFNVTGDGGTLSIEKTQGPDSSLFLYNPKINLTYLSSNHLTLSFSGSYNGTGTDLVLANGTVTPLLMVGIQISFNNSYSVYIGFNSTIKSPQYDSTGNAIYILTSNFTVNFNQILNLSLPHIPNFKNQYASFSYMLKSKNPLSYTFSFYNIELS
jgi:uncharacterized membrane protein